MGVSFNISWQGKRYMPNNAVYVRVCPCVRVCVYVWMRAKVNFGSKQSSHSLTKSTQVTLILEQMFFLFIYIFIFWV